MVIGKNKWVAFRFLPHEYEGLEVYLEKMALEGWILDQMSGQYLKFIKGAPKMLTYSVNFVTRKFGELEGNNKDLEYRDFCEKAGWDFVCQYGKVQVYCSESDKKRIEIHTDEAEKFKVVKEESIKRVIPEFLLLLLFLYYLYGAINDFISKSGELPIYITVVFIIGTLLFIVFQVIGLYSFLSFIIKGRENLSRGIAPKYGSINISLYRRLLFNGYFIVVTIIVIMMITPFFVYLLSGL